MSSTLSSIAARLGRTSGLDAVATPLGDAVTRVIPSGAVKDALSGVGLGHPVHPMLTDLPIGFWTSSFVLDLVGGRPGRNASAKLVGLGVLSALPAMLAGASDWGDTTGPARRVGLVHATANTVAVACYGASWWSRRRGHHLRGVSYALAGATAATVGGYLGGHLLQGLGVGVDNTAFETRADGWTPAVAAADVTEQLRCVDVAGAPVVVFRRDARVVAVGGRCPHRGAPMAEGALERDAIVCPWHASRFRLRDGGVERGPSAMSLPAYECRVRDDVVEVRARRSPAATPESDRKART